MMQLETICGCGWPFYSAEPVKLLCPMCGEVVSLGDNGAWVSTAGATQTVAAQTAATKATSLWTPLHQYGADNAGCWNVAEAKAWYAQWLTKIPGYGCGACTKNWDGYAAANPPDFSSAEAFFSWGVNAHNHVSVFHVAEYRPTLSLRDAAKLYGFHDLQIEWQRKRPVANPTIAFIAVSYINAGGTETYHQSLLPRLPNVAGLGVSGRCEGDVTRLGTTIKCPKELAYRADVLVAWGVDGMASYLPNPRPKVISVHHADWASEWSNRSVLEQLDVIDEIVCVNEDTSHRMRTLTDKPVHYIPNCVDPARIVPTAESAGLREKWGISESARVVLFGHRMSVEKRPLLAIKVASMLPDDYVMVMAGYGHLFEACQAAAGPDVRFVGVTDGLADWLDQADCFLSLSQIEGFGLSIAEAMLAGVPVVSTPTGIALTPGLAVTLESDSPSQWAQAIVQSVDSDTADQVRFAQQYCQQHWSMEEFVRRWRDILCR